MAEKKRYHLLDVLRGLCLIVMIYDHVMYDLDYVADVPWADFSHWAVQLPGTWCAFGFWILSGACFHLSRRPLKNARKILAGALAVSAVTIPLIPGGEIWFGVLHGIGCAYLLTVLLHPWLKKVNPFVGLGVSAVLFCLLWLLPQGQLGCLSIPLVNLPVQWYQFAFLAPLGLPSPDFYSADYFPLLPWVFAFWMGYFGWQCNGVKEWVERRNNLTCPPLQWMGRNSLLLYLVHQPVLYGLTLLIF